MKDASSRKMATNDTDAWMSWRYWFSSSARKMREATQPRA
jgi:hypothetical protein